MNRSLRFCTICALLALFTACAANPKYAPDRRAPTYAEVAAHNAVMPRNLQLRCGRLYNTGTYVKRRVCWLQQDMHLRQYQRQPIWLPNSPADSQNPVDREDLLDHIPMPENILDL